MIKDYNKRISIADVYSFGENGYQITITEKYKHKTKEIQTIFVDKINIEIKNKD